MDGLDYEIVPGRLCPSGNGTQSAYEDVLRAPPQNYAAQDDCDLLNPGGAGQKIDHCGMGAGVRPSC